jgi:hypothetical protein
MKNNAGEYLPSCVSGEGGIDLQLFFMTFPTLLLLDRISLQTSLSPLIDLKSQKYSHQNQQITTLLLQISTVVCMLNATIGN